MSGTQRFSLLTCVVSLNNWTIHCFYSVVSVVSVAKCFL